MTHVETPEAPPRDDERPVLPRGLVTLAWLDLLVLATTAPTLLALGGIGRILTLGGPGPSAAETGAASWQLAAAAVVAGASVIVAIAVGGTASRLRARGLVVLAALTGVIGGFGALVLMVLAGSVASGS